MENTTKSKVEFIEAWDSHIKDLAILGFCNDQVLHNRVKKIRDELHEIVRRIAETKSLE